MNKLRLSLFVLSLLIITNSSINAQDNEQNIRSNRKTKTTTTTTTYSGNTEKHQKDALTLINGQTETFSFGNNIKVGNPVEHNFQFRNNGTTPIQITNVSSSCGCTTPEWSNKPIAPKQTGNVKVRYNSAAVGKFHKSITLTLQDQSTKTLWIQGEVIK